MLYKWLTFRDAYSSCAPAPLVPFCLSLSFFFKIILPASFLNILLIILKMCSTYHIFEIITIEIIYNYHFSQLNFICFKITFSIIYIWFYNIFES